MKKRILSLSFLLLFVISFLTSCGGVKEFTHCELTLPLGRDFEEKESTDYDLLLSDGKIAVAVTRITFIAGYNQGIPDTYSAKAFANFFMKKSGNGDTVLMLGDVPYFTYTADGKNTEMFYLVTFYRSLNAYFIVTYASKEQDREETEARMFDYVASVYFNDAPKI